jgi:hypothetical protein
MAPKRREIQMLYGQDRLGDEKISQVYRVDYFHPNPFFTAIFFLK